MVRTRLNFTQSLVTRRMESNCGLVVPQWVLVQERLAKIGWRWRLHLAAHMQHRREYYHRKKTAAIPLPSQLSRNRSFQNSVGFCFLGACLAQRRILLQDKCSRQARHPRLAMHLKRHLIRITQIIPLARATACAAGQSSCSAESRCWM